MTDTDPGTSTPPPATSDGDEREGLGDEVRGVVESAAELGLGAVIGPFAGGETVDIVGSVASMWEAGVDRLTHLGEHETVHEAAPEADTAEPEAMPDDQAGDGRP